MRLTALLVFLTISCLASDPYKRQPGIDITHYIFKLELNDTNNEIAGEADITVRFVKPATGFELDLIGKKSAETGMIVSEVWLGRKKLQFTHDNDRIKIVLPSGARAGSEKTFTVKYKGIPADGLIISKNKFGDRTFFGDNWPDRGHHWLPTIDHPYDKSTVEFIVTAPDHYKVVATGALTEEKKLDNSRTLTHYKESVPVSVKVMTIGVARFSVTQSGQVNKIPVTTWVYPQNEKEGFSDFAVAPKVLQYFNDNVGPYPYEKLAHVQSKTVFGGLENASNIFYFENSVNGKNERESLIAHETAHQWFGNSASELDWHHVWLSEGFATYFTDLYLENTYGRKRLEEAALKKRKEVLNYFRKNPAPIVDTTITNIHKVLSTNTYAKAGWVLHMLRNEVGNDNFWKGIRAYYNTYKGKNALTRDFQTIMERESGKDLSQFFQEWIFRGGHPVLTVSTDYDSQTKNLKIQVSQNDRIMHFPLEIAFYPADSTAAPASKTFRIEKEMQEFFIPMSEEPSKIELDPHVNLLFEEKPKN